MVSEELTLEEMVEQLRQRVFREQRGEKVDRPDSERTVTDEEYQAWKRDFNERHEALEESLLRRLRWNPLTAARLYEISFELERVKRRLGIR